MKNLYKKTVKREFTFLDSIQHTQYNILRISPLSSAYFNDILTQQNSTGKTNNTIYLKKTFFFFFFWNPQPSMVKYFSMSFLLLWFSPQHNSFPWLEKGLFKKYSKWNSFKGRVDGTISYIFSIVLRKKEEKKCSLYYRCGS